MCIVYNRRRLKNKKCLYYNGNATMTTPSEVLLVGEGNFSFSAALCQAAAGSAKVTATCFQAEDEVRQQDGVEVNIQRLRDFGGDVHFQVDCTRLVECTALKHRLFDCVIFNFPHCGRKSGVKKNRSLLTKFFLSCVQVLKDSGEVHVALCNGQGGTPVDKPMREWHNSWQAVARAAEAGLILKEICQFEPDKYQGYRCTGYRSQDKGFHVEGALNHIFTRSIPYTVLQSVNMEATLGGETVVYKLPEELSEYVNRNFLGAQSHHPVKIVQEQLLRVLQSMWPVHMVDTNFPELFQYSPKRLQACDRDVSSPDVYWIRPTDSRKLGKEDNCNKDGPSRGYGLRPSLLVHIQEIIQHPDVFPGDLHALSGLVFRRVPVSRSGSPAFHQLLLMGVLPMESQPILRLRGCLETLLAPHDFSFEDEQTSNSQRVWVTLKHSKVGLLESLPASMDGPQGQLLCITALNLDLLAAQLFSIKDWRLLWSVDPRFLAHFLPKSPGPFHEFSLYPPAYTHDISFWVENDCFDELTFHSLVRQVSGGAVREVALMDRFQHPHTGHASLCYRLTYQSPDRALSQSQALGMQLMLRRLLPLNLQVTLR